MAPRLSGDYGEPITRTSFSALIELGTVLGSYRDALVLVGGWVPYFLLEDNKGPDAGFRHVGSIDIDFAVDPAIVDSAGYAEIVELIRERGYSQRKDEGGRPILFSFGKPLVSPVDGREYPIQVDFLTMAGTELAGRHRHRKVQPGLPARIVPGCELAFTHYYRRKVRGQLPGDGETVLEMRLLDMVGCIGMKGIVLGERYKEKDAYDIFAVASKCLENPGMVARKVRPFAEEAGMMKGLDKIREKFRDQRADGPNWVAAFMSMDSEERKRINAEVYVKLKEFIDELD